MVYRPEYGSRPGTILQKYAAQWRETSRLLAAERPDVKGLFLLADYPAISVQAGTTTNTLSVEVLAEFDRVLDEVAAGKPRGMVIRSGKQSGFIAGAEFVSFVGGFLPARPDGDFAGQLALPGGEADGALNSSRDRDDSAAIGESVPMEPRGSPPVFAIGARMTRGMTFAALMDGSRSAEAVGASASQMPTATPSTVPG